MDRVPLIDKTNKPFIMCSEDGTVQVEFIEVVGCGGSAVVYKGRKKVGNRERACVIKEYYPLKPNQVNYVREGAGKHLRIVPIVSGSLEESTGIRENELQKQKNNVARELKMAREIFYNHEKNENSPYLYEAEFFRAWGDSTYVILDTSEGKTLKAYLDESGGIISLKEAVKYLEKLLAIIRQMLDGKYCHGDIKTENIWLRGKDAAESMCLLDFGSVFSYEEFQADPERLSPEELMQRAEEILFAEGVGTSTDGYYSKAMFNLMVSKNAYAADKCPGNRRKTFERSRSD